MNYQGFKNSIKKELEKLFPMKEIIIHKVLKNKSEELDVLQVLNSKRAVISPVIYLNEYYQAYKSGKEINGIVRDIYKIITGIELSDINRQSIIDISKVKNRICYKLINSEKNRKFLKTLPHIPYHDLSIVFYIMEEDAKDLGTELVKNDLTAYWEMDANALYELADENTARLLPHNFQDMSHLLIKRLSGAEKNDNSLLDVRTEASPFDTSLYVLTNRKDTFGAACILYTDMLERIAKFLGGKDYYILPSSRIRRDYCHIIFRIW